MKRRWAGRKAQINLSFGMIFSIILIIIFLAFAFYAISKFLNIQKAAKTAQFVDAFRADVGRMWKSSSGSQRIEYKLPGSVEYVCLADFSSQNTGTKREIYDTLRTVYFNDENLFFYPVGSGGAVDSARIDNINLPVITAGENPYCINNVDGKISLTIKKGLNDALVTVTK